MEFHSALQSNYAIPSSRSEIPHFFAKAWGVDVVNNFAILGTVVSLCVTEICSLLISLGGFDYHFGDLKI